MSATVHLDSISLPLLSLSCTSLPYWVDFITSFFSSDALVNSFFLVLVRSLLIRRVDGWTIPPDYRVERYFFKISVLSYRVSLNADMSCRSPLTGLFGLFASISSNIYLISFSSSMCSVFLSR